MPINPTKALLDQILEGDVPTAATLDDLRSNHSEGQWLDFKSGKLTNDKEAKEKLREYVAGFANADGGLLVIGVEDKGSPKKVDGCKQIGGRPLDEWAPRMIQQFAPSFSVQPKFKEVAHTDGAVLVGAIPRAPLLIPITKDGQLRYPIRIGESTVIAPDYLVSDLILGRRNRPILDIKARITPRLQPSGVDDRFVQLSGGSVVVENVSMVLAKDVRLGAVYWVGGQQVGATHSQLLAHVEAAKPDDRLSVESQITWGLAHPKLGLHGAPTIAPFDSVYSTDLSIQIPHRNNGSTTRLAMYVVAEGTIPDWFEVEIIDRTGSNLPPTWSIKKCYSDRPRVSWTPSV